MRPAVASRVSDASRLRTQHSPAGSPTKLAASTPPAAGRPKCRAPCSGCTASACLAKALNAAAAKPHTSSSAPSACPSPSAWPIRLWPWSRPVPGPHSGPPCTRSKVQTRCLPSANSTLGFQPVAAIRFALPQKTAPQSRRHVLEPVSTASLAPAARTFGLCDRFCCDED